MLFQSQSHQRYLASSPALSWLSLEAQGFSVHLEEMCSAQVESPRHNSWNIWAWLRSSLLSSFVAVQS
jgi:hypothetical protein